MKTLLLFLICTFSITLLFAQTSEPVDVINKGTRFIGGSFSFTASKREEDYRYTEISIGPGFGYYVKDDLAVGGFLSYTFGKNESFNTNSASSNSGIGLNVFLLKNYKIVNNLFFTLQPQTSLGFTSQEFTNFAASNYTGFDFSLGVSPGIMFFVGRKFAFQTSLANLNYSFTRRKSENSGELTTTHNFRLNGNLAISSLSIRYFLW